MTGKLKIILSGVGVAIVVIVGVLGWVYTELQPVKSADLCARAFTQECAAKRFVIAKGQSVIKTAQKLQEAGLIKNAQLFRFYAQYQKLDVKMQAGSYELSPNFTTAQIAEKLTQGSEDIWVTLLEGWRVEEVAEYLAEQGLPEFDAVQFGQMAEESEGTIFPDSYLVPRESTAQQLYDLFVATFEKKVLIGLENEVAASGKDISEVVTLASIVEREGRSFEDMRHVAGILQNRIDLGMPLQADATLQYIAGKDNETGKWWQQPSIEVKKSTSLYNTYMNPDLPPGPICNPGLNAIKAVLDPVASNDLFYIHTPSGEAYYAETLEEHNANIDKYLR